MQQIQNLGPIVGLIVLNNEDILSTLDNAYKKLIRERNYSAKLFVAFNQKYPQTALISWSNFKTGKRVLQASRIQSECFHKNTVHENSKICCELWADYTFREETHDPSSQTLLLQFLLLVVLTFLNAFFQQQRWP